MPTTEYDYAIKEANERYLYYYDWRMYKAQLIAESDLNPVAVSPVGAQGIAQFMPGTWRDVSAELFGSRFLSKLGPNDPNLAIPAGAYYMRSLIRKWTTPRPLIDRYCLALASYNAGFGHILRAQKLANNAADYASIIKPLSKVTGVSHSHETKTYVKRILTIYNRLVTS